MKKESNLIIYDLILYLVFPLVLYKFLKPYLGDYWAMIVPTIPGILYTLFRFWYTKQFNITGIFIISTMTVSTAVDLLAGNAKNLILYNVYYHFALVVVFLLLLALKKPLPYYFMIDIAAIQGQDREESKKLYKHPSLFKLFQYLFVAWIIKDLVFAFAQWWMVDTYGIKAYYSRTIIFTVGGYVFGIIMAIGYAMVTMRAQKLKGDDSGQTSDEIII
ncbi:VC0807 family protein [Gottfriedia luciferensis]|uniref:VC0807 family protein n=1 Tax=Gottfriedia luciferensis TaxID=178774 RepID=UPI000B454908|nr:VC0807 family protein [Gottfriedia luciferensis]